MLLLQAQSAATGQSSWMSLAMLGLIIVVFYFFMIKPQIKRQKEARKFQQELQKGSKILLSGGMLGEVAELKENTLMVEIAKGVTVEVLRSTVMPATTPSK